jgi:hypothetical protein
MSSSKRVTGPSALDEGVKSRDSYVFRIVVIVSLVLLAIGYSVLLNRLVRVEDDFYEHHSHTITDQSSSSIEAPLTDNHYVTENITFTWHTWNFQVAPNIGEVRRYPDTGSIPHLDTDRLVYYTVCCHSDPKFVCVGSAAKRSTGDMEADAFRDPLTSDQVILVSIRTPVLAGKICVYSFAMANVGNDAL